MATTQRVSALDGLIRAGKADPISDEERQIVAKLRANLDRRTRGRTSSTPILRDTAKFAS